jgi:hypothetical protein
VRQHGGLFWNRLNRDDLDRWMTAQDIRDHRPDMGAYVHEAPLGTAQSGQQYAYGYILADRRSLLRIGPHGAPQVPKLPDVQRQMSNSRANKFYFKS